MAAVIQTTQAFATTNQVTAGKLNAIQTGSSFAAAAVDNVTTQISGDAIIVKSGGVDTSQLADNAVTSAKLDGDAIYPVGSVYINATDSRNPSILLGFGTWAPFGAGKVPVGIDATDNDFNAVGSGLNTNETTGAKTHTLATSEIPAHVHGSELVSVNSNEGRVTFSNNRLENDAERATFKGDTDPTGGGGSHNNLQPYIVVYMWQRTA